LFWIHVWLTAPPESLAYNLEGPNGNVKPPDDHELLQFVTVT